MSYTKGQRITLAKRARLYDAMQLTYTSEIIEMFVQQPRVETYKLQSGQKPKIRFYADMWRSRPSNGDTERYLYIDDVLASRARISKRQGFWFLYDNENNCLGGMWDIGAAKKMLRALLLHNATFERHNNSPRLVSGPDWVPNQPSCLLLSERVSDLLASMRRCDSSGTQSDYWRGRITQRLRRSLSEGEFRI